MTTRTIPKGTPEYLADQMIQDLIARRAISRQVTMHHLEEIIIGIHRDTQALRAEVEVLKVQIYTINQTLKDDVDGRG